MALYWLLLPCMGVPLSVKQLFLPISCLTCHVNILRFSPAGHPQSSKPSWLICLVAVRKYIFSVCLDLLGYRNCSAQACRERVPLLLQRFVIQDWKGCKSADFQAVSHIRLFCFPWRFLWRFDAYSCLERAADSHIHCLDIWSEGPE